LAQKPNEGLPLIPIKAVAGVLQSGEHGYAIMEYECERYIIPLLERMGAQFYIEVRGDSMMPTYKPGDILGYRAVPLNDIFFQWNKVYLCVTKQEPLLKRVKKGSDNDHIMLVSDNDFYEPFEIHRTQLLAVAIVVGRIGVE